MASVEEKSTQIAAKLLSHWEKNLSLLAKSYTHNREVASSNTTELT